MRVAASLLLTLALGAVAQEEEEEKAQVAAICEGKEAAGWFRLTNYDCKQVVQCTSAGLQQIKCPDQLHFDLEQQACNWKSAVHNCDLLVKPQRALPRLNTEEPFCTTGPRDLACGDGTCIAPELFCDGKADCADSSDENVCDPETDPNRAPKCSPEECQLPACFCSEDGTVIPGGLPVAETPQMIIISFNGAINNNNIALFDDLFNDERVNPNGCPIKGTFFVSHKYTNYTAVQDLHSRGHEIAVFSVTQNDTLNYWNNLTREEWASEMAGQRYIIETFANITDQSVVGMRTPYLRVGGNNQFFMMDEHKFLYDATLSAPLSDIPKWPYTMLNQMPHVCHGDAQKCPTRAFPVWEMVLNELDRREDPSIDDNLPGCLTVDSCSNILNGDMFYNFLNNNFDRHYLTNRAPLSLNFHSAWLKNADYLDILLYWIEEILGSTKDVYFVTMTQVIEWMQQTPSVAQTATFDAWQTKCNARVPFPCPRPGGNNCALRANGVQGTYNMQTCLKCPAQFPWLDNLSGEA